MFGPISPTVKNLLSLANSWKKNQNFQGASNTFTQENLSTTPISVELLQNLTPATVGAQQVSPATQWRGNGWKTGGTAASQKVDFRSYVLPIQSAGSTPDGVWKLQQSMNELTFSDVLDVYSRNPDGNTGGRLDIAGSFKANFNQANGDPSTSRAVDLNNTAGTHTNVAYSFNGVQKAAVTIGVSGETIFKQINNGSGYLFMAGGSISGQSLMAQLYSGGLYVQGGGFFSQRVTAGQAMTTPPATLNSFGSYAAKYVLVTAAALTLSETQSVVYARPETPACGGTPSVTACSTYSASGQATCESHLPCAYTAEVTTQCSTAGNNTDSGTCTGQNAACSWSTANCNTGNNDSAVCAALGFPSGGFCTFTPAACAGFTSTATCDAQSGNGCTTNTNPCSAFDNTDQATCEANIGCSYVGDPVCSGTYFASCTGTYTGPNGDCTGSYDTGGCAGSWVSSPAVCSGTVSCSSFLTESPCNLESGCLWQTVVALTLPTTASTSDLGGTSRIYDIMHIGTSGTVTINPNTGQGFFLYSALTLRVKGDRVKLQHVYETTSCSTILTESPCNAQSPCVWQAAVVCSSFGDGGSCTSAGCSWDGFVCTGAGTPAQCGGGGYISINQWMPLIYTRALSYVNKTAAYTLTIEDDVVTCTSGAFALTLPTAVGSRSQKYYLKNTGAGTITINTTSAQTIDGNASGTLTLTTNQSMTVISNNANWVIV